MALFYVPDIAKTWELSEEEAAHALRVLRLPVGAELEITDGKGNLYRCEVASAHQKHCLVRVVEHFEEFEKLPYRLTMAVAPTKNIDRYEWFLEKATEIGVAEFVPLVSEHSERKVIKHEREEKVITSAVKQSLKAYHPKLHDMTSVRDIIAMDFDGDKFIAHCDKDFGERAYLGNLVKKGANTLILIGPEGDFSKEEINFAAQNGFKAISLGRERLRTETAAVVATTVVSTINKL